MKATPPALVTIEPALLGHRHAAAFLSVSQRLLDEFVRRGVVRPVHIPGVRRVCFHVQELRAVAAKWRSQRDHDRVEETRA